VNIGVPKQIRISSEFMVRIRLIDIYPSVKRKLATKLSLLLHNRRRLFLDLLTCTFLNSGGLLYS
jgi:hypothetical protein